ncbi:MAG TPA: MoxR family ATPase [Vicinamibacterales bacterium]
MAATVTSPALETSDDIAHADRLKAGCDQIRAELRKLIVGQDAVVELILLSILTGGNSLVIGVPGLAKTLLINTFARALDLKFSRIQFTPDLMPSDITGTEIIQDDPNTGRRRMVFVPGPIFANIVLADEINRTPPKTQAALLEAMQEYQVTVGGVRHALERPLFVLATQNPIEQEGTYSLPEAQLDRFMFNVVIDYPSRDEERRILATTTGSGGTRIEAVASGPEIERLHTLVRDVPAADNVIDRAATLVRATRPAGAEAPEFVRKWVRWGAGPRAGQALLLGAKARALLDGRVVADVRDVDEVALPVLRHRVLVNFQGEADGIDADEIVQRLLTTAKVGG